MERRVVRVDVNGERVEALVEPRKLLADFIREDAGLTGTHLGCEHGVCGACTILLDGVAVRSCLLFAPQGDGRSVQTVESLAGSDGTMHPLQQAFHETHALQCGFCTPGFLLSIISSFEQHGPPVNDHQIRELLSGNICRCTGYHNIVAAVRLYRDRVAAAA